MQADEIIQQKEWHELNADEQAIVKELADNEQEYNLLKKMLQISAEEATQVPEVSVRIHEELVTVMAVKKVSYKRYVFAAAAAILAFVLATVFLQKENKPSIPVAKIDTLQPATSPALVKKKIVIKADTNIIIIQPKNTQQLPEKSSPQLVRHNLKKQSVPSFVQPTSNEPVYAALNKKIADEKELLNLVTEMY